MSDIYARSQATASGLMSRYAQGVVTYNEPGAPSGEPWNPQPGAWTAHELDATARGVSQQYIDGTSVLATDKEVTAAVFGATPTTSGTLTIDGQTLQIVRVWQVPAAGTPVAWKMICRA